MMPGQEEYYEPAKRARGRPSRGNMPPKMTMEPVGASLSTALPGQTSLFMEPMKKLHSLEEAALHCKVTARTLKLYMEKYPDLVASAVKARGTGHKSNGWQIDLVALDTWRRKTGFLVTDDIGPMGEFGTTRRRIPETERRARLQSEMLEMEIAQKRGNLIDKTEVISKMRTAFARLAKRLDLLPNIVGRKCELSPEVVEVMRNELDGARRSLALDSDEYFSEGK